MQSVKLMDTRATAGQKRLPKLARTYARWWSAMLCVLVCGCDSLKPAHTRRTADPPAATEVTESSDQVGTRPPLTATTAALTDPTPQPPDVRAKIGDPPPAPALSPAPAAHPAKSNQKLLLPGASAGVQASHAATNSAANPHPPQTTVTYMPREAAAAIIIKGPPRQPQPPSSRIGITLCLGMSFGAGVVAIVFYAKRRSSVPSVQKAPRQELFLPSEFRLKDSAIQPEAPFGMLARVNPESRSKVQLLFSALAATTNASRFLASKLPLDRVGEAFQAVRQRFSAPLPAISEQSPSSELSSEAADSKPGEISDTTESLAGNGVQAKPAEVTPPVTLGATASAPLEAPTQNSTALAQST
jgi:hypothetical protein